MKPFFTRDDCLQVTSATGIYDGFYIDPEYANDKVSSLLKENERLKAAAEDREKEVTEYYDHINEDNAHAVLRQRDRIVKLEEALRGVLLSELLEADGHKWETCEEPSCTIARAALGDEK